MGLGFDPAYPNKTLTYEHTPSDCSDGGASCNFPITASQISFPIPDPTNTSAGDLAGILSGGVSNSSSGNFCASPNLNGLPSGYWFYNGAQPNALSVAEVTFSPPIDIDQLALWEQGADPNVINPRLTIEYTTCDCPDEWKQYIVHNFVESDARSVYARTVRRVSKLRFTKLAINIAGISICAEETTCSSRKFTEEPIVVVDEVGIDFGKVSWVSAFDPASQTEASSYVIELSKQLTDAGYLQTPDQFVVDATHGAQLEKQFADLQSGVTYYGKVRPGQDCYEEYISPSVLEPRPYSSLDPSFFKFTSLQVYKFGRAARRRTKVV